MATGLVEIAVWMNGTYIMITPRTSSKRKDRLPHLLFKPCSSKDKNLVLLMIWLAICTRTAAKKNAD